MNKIFKGGIAFVLAAVILLSATSCGGNKKSELDLNKFPLVFADSKGLEAINEGEAEPTLITKNFYTFLNAENKVQAASNGKIYYIETKNRKTTLGDLYAYDVEKKESELIHSGVYSYKVSHDGECLIISDGSGNIFKYNKRHEKKNDYKYIQNAGVSSVIDISADGKYVLYSQILKGTNHYTLTLAKTDFETSDELEKLSLKEKKANTNISKAPVIIAQNYRQFIGSSDDLSVIYYETAGEKKDSPNKLCAFKNLKENVVLSDKSHEVYFVNSSGEICYSQTEKNTKKASDVITDKYEKKDSKLKKASASKKDWSAKLKRDDLRNKLEQYLQNISSYSFFKFSASEKEPQKYLQLYGQMSKKGIDDELGFVFFGANIYDFTKAKKPDINKVSVVYKLFDEIKTREFLSVGLKGEARLDIGEKVSYNSGDVYVDTANKKVNIIMDFDYLKGKVGTLYTVAFDSEGFGNSKLISDKAAKVAHFDSKDGSYFVTKNGNLVLDNPKNIVLESYAYAHNDGRVKIAFTSKDTGKKDEYGNAITDDTAFLIKGNQAIKIGKMFVNKELVIKGDMFAFYTDYDYKKTSGSMTLYNGEKLIKFDDEVSMVYKFG